MGGRLTDDGGPGLGPVAPRARRRARSPEAEREREALSAVIEAIGAELELRPLLTRILRHACDLIGADDGAIGLVDESTHVVRTEAAHSLPDDEIGAELPEGVGLAGEVMRRGGPVVAARYGDLPHPTQLQLLDNAVIGVPIRWGGRMIGFFGIGRAAWRTKGGERVFRRPTPFSARDAETLLLFARHAAIAIENARRYDRERKRTERLALIARVGRAIAGNLRLEELLQRAADAVHDLLGYQNVAIPLLEPEHPGVLLLRTVGGTYRDILRGEYRIPLSRGIMAEAARTARTVLVNDVRRDPRHLPTPGAAGIVAELAVPIAIGERVLGVLNVESASAFSEEDAASLEIVADQLAVAIENARLYEASQRVAVLEERQRLARELHDSVTQHLFSATLIAQTIASAARRDPDEAERRAARLVELSRVSLSEMRALLRELRPTSPAGARPGAKDPVAAAGAPQLTAARRLADHGLAGALEQLVSDVRQDGALQVALDAARYLPQPARCEEALYRIAQEALANIVKHARARRVEVRLASGDDGVWLEVDDDGRGFDPAAVAEPRSGDSGSGRSGGIGLASMRERAAALGGVLTMATAAGRGTVVAVTLPPQWMTSR